jgi:hypothetical protein
MSFSKGEKTIMADHEEEPPKLRNSMLIAGFWLKLFCPDYECHLEESGQTVCSGCSGAQRFV